MGGPGANYRCRVTRQRMSVYECGGLQLNYPFIFTSICKFAIKAINFCSAKIQSHSLDLRVRLTLDVKKEKMGNKGGETITQWVCLEKEEALPHLHNLTCKGCERNL